MRLDRRIILIAGGSLLWGLIVSLLFYRAAAKARAAAPEQPVVVAAQPLAPGIPVTSDVVKLARIPDHLFPRGGFSKIEDVVGRPVISSIQPDEPVVEARVAPRGSGFGVAPMIPAGMRAMAVRVNDVAGVAGFVLPGMRVDVLVTGRPAGVEDTTTTTVLQNVLVLSAGQVIEADARSQSINAAVVTLLVSPRQAESLALASNEGKIQLDLRNSGDQQESPATSRQLRELYGRTGPAAPPIAPRALSDRPRPPRIEAIAPPSVTIAPVMPPIPVYPAAQTMILFQGAHKTVETFPPKVTQ